MSILSGLRVYLCGPVESDPNAANWRKTLANKLLAIEPSLAIWDPLVKPDWVGDVANDEMAFGWKKHVFERDDNDLYLPKLDRGKACFDTNISVRRICKQLASKCDIIVARVSKTFTWGSIDELEIATQRRIPIFIWLPDGPISIYGIAGCVPRYELVNDYVHFSEESLLNKVSAINNGSSGLPERDQETWMCLTWRKAGDQT